MARSNRTRRLLNQLKEVTVYNTKPFYSGEETGRFSATWFFQADVPYTLLDNGHGHKGRWPILVTTDGAELKEEDFMKALREMFPSIRFYQTVKTCRSGMWSKTSVRSKKEQLGPLLSFCIDDRQFVHVWQIVIRFTIPEPPVNW